MTRKKVAGKTPARPKATKAKTAAQAAPRPKATSTRSRSKAAKARTAVPEAAGEPAEQTLPAIAAAYVPPAMASSSPALVRRRAILFDVENTSRTEDIEKVLAHLAVDFTRGGVDFTAVGNWRVIGHEPARLLAARGAALVHSAPSSGVRDWSDLRIAVAAGVWLATAQPGDALEIVSDDQAFEAVGDVAASRGVLFRRVSYRQLAGLPLETAPVVRESASGDSRRRRRRGGRRAGRPEEAPHRMPAHHAPHAPAHAPAHAARSADAPVPGAQTAPLDELLEVVHQMLARTPGGISLDALANALKGRGFRRRPGSPRLITRLKLIKDIVIDRGGMIRLAGDGGAEERGTEGRTPEAAEPSSPALALAPPDDDDELEAGGAAEADDDTAAAGGEPAGDGPTNGRRRRRRRGGRRRRGRRGGSGAPVEAAAASS